MMREAAWQYFRAALGVRLSPVAFAPWRLRGVRFKPCSAKFGCCAAARENCHAAGLRELMFRRDLTDSRRLLN